MALQFHERTKQVMNFATMEAQSAGNDNLLTGRHIFIAMVKEGTSVVARLLLDVGANLDEIRARKYPSSRLKVQRFTFTETDTVKAALKTAVLEAESMGDKEICPIHLFLRLIRIADPEVLAVLTSFKLEAKVVIEQVITAYQEKKQAKALMTGLAKKAPSVWGSSFGGSPNVLHVDMELVDSSVVKALEAWLRLSPGKAITKMAFHIDD